MLSYAASARDVLCQAIDAGVTDAQICLLHDGQSTRLGRTRPGGAADVTIGIEHPRFFSRVVGYGNLGLGEAFMDGDFHVVAGTLHEFLTILLRGRLDRVIRGDLRLALRTRGIQLANRIAGARVNVRSHYDAGDDLFEAFLDDSLTYSCGYACSPNDDLEQLQVNKFDRICRKLRLRPGHRLLDIGCGFGSLLMHAARHHGVTGVGVTLSERHGRRAEERIRDAGLSGLIRIEVGDYAAIRQRFDRIVSVGMLEHVRPADYGRYFRYIARAIEPDGLGLVHTIGCNSSDHSNDPFIQRYVFPGSNQPRLSDMAVGLERNRLAILDVENMVRHYALTVSRWLERFECNQVRLDPVRYPLRFRRMWTYYLSCGIAAARASESALYQVLFSPDYAADLPLHRV